jgi:hypothetical protein
MTASGLPRRVSGGEKLLPSPEQNRFAAVGIFWPRRDSTNWQALLVLLTNRSCVSMIAPPLSQTVGLHFVLVCCRPGGREMLFLLLRQLLIS